MFGGVEWKHIFLLIAKKCADTLSSMNFQVISCSCFSQSAHYLDRNPFCCIHSIISHVKLVEIL